MANFIFKVVSDEVEIFNTVEELTDKYKQVGLIPKKKN